VQIAVAGATGFVGRALVPRLAVARHGVVALTRRDVDVPPAATRIVELSDGAAVTTALTGCEAACYLVHSLATGDFRTRDRQLAETFGRAAADAGVERIVYLGGLGEDPESEHLTSRQEVGVALGHAGVPVVELRAAVVLGAGGISFEMLRYLTERLPVMVCPRWVRTAIQPVALSDMLEYLVAALDVAPGVYEIGGADVTTYREMIATYARVRGLRRRRILDVPYLTPRLSSYWVDFVTPVDQTVSHSLIESLTTEVVVQRPERTAAAFGIEPMTTAAAVEVALARQVEIFDRELLERERGLADGVYVERVAANCDPSVAERIDADLDRVGGSYRWYGPVWGWYLRAALGRLLREQWVLRRPVRVEAGATVDWWRVTRRDPGTLVLRAQRWAPGDGWLGFGVRDATVTVVAALRPKGVPGFLYWRLLVPLHRRVFAGLAHHRVDRATAATEGYLRRRR
jgi:uncharacterized protein YbjT (DUF2867 family)